jgi:hypothetical protein
VLRVEVVARTTGLVEHEHFGERQRRAMVIGLFDEARPRGRVAQRHQLLAVDQAAQLAP